MKKVLVITGLVFLLAGNSFSNSIKLDENISLSSFIQNSYSKLQFDGKKPDFDIYKKGLIGYLNLKKQNKLSGSGLLTLIDFRLSSNKKRLWIIDLKQSKVIHHSLVAHGRNTGNEFAKKFSNVPNSNSSSLGFYITGETYFGKHGLSLRLDGIEPGFNNNARQRAVVMHGADYVDPSYTKAYGRIGRSFGCPSIPMKGHKEIIKKLANKSCMFIYYPDKDYLANSKLANEASAYDVLSKADFSL
ncbi:murein L,D-transpeptidase catalytic domain family protein [Fulvivirga kasyanovii]|uniref:Murein L,D-transpeptidase catalytic domain family protein n=1 Tax=Fulvivirga kasyanovii TaxID=396812 RepID=A0ABW9RVL5_9BACT|nr:murein L,D-transpeptidase catalytic domain family protein [Fulvivirga kasyanovii]MTI27951.1 murein L,D-transpeptidase catalytic domain family protein [Fulvivirga kasyanovii]